MRSRNPSIGRSRLVSRGHRDAERHFVRAPLAKPVSSHTQERS
jgi:hypothetical protein